MAEDVGDVLSQSEYDNIRYAVTPIMTRFDLMGQRGCGAYAPEQWDKAVATMEPLVGLWELVVTLCELEGELDC